VTQSRKAHERTTAVQSAEMAPKVQLGNDAPSVAILAGLKRGIAIGASATAEI
jgi:hypothetical protein